MKRLTKSAQCVERERERILIKQWKEEITI